MAIKPELERAMMLDKTCKLISYVGSTCKYLEHCELLVHGYTDRVQAVFGVLGYAIDGVLREFVDFVDEYVDEHKFVYPLHSADNWTKTE